nr:hypothetical protein CFP56_40403 [Quercus suber]
MEPEFQQATSCSSEEEEELIRSVKKFKDNSIDKPFTEPRSRTVKIEDESDSKMEDLTDGSAEVKLSKETKAQIKAPWSKALIVKVYGRTLGYNYLIFKINTLWNPMAKMDCVNLGKYFFLIKFSDEGDYDNFLCGGP